MCKGRKPEPLAQVNINIRNVTGETHPWKRLCLFMSNNWFHKEDKTTFTEHVSKLGNPVTTHLARRTFENRIGKTGACYVRRVNLKLEAINGEN